MVPPARRVPRRRRLAGAARRYGDIRKALLSIPAVADADRSLPVPASPHDWLAERRCALAEGLRRLAAAARAGAIAGGSTEDSLLPQRVSRSPVRARARAHRRDRRQDGSRRAGRAADLVADLYRRMPDARITDILLEVDDATGFTEAFTHFPAHPTRRLGRGAQRHRLCRVENSPSQKTSPTRTHQSIDDANDV